MNINGWVAFIPCFVAGFLAGHFFFKARSLEHNVKMLVFLVSQQRRIIEAQDNRFLAGRPTVTGSQLPSVRIEVAK